VQSSGCAESYKKGRVFFIGACPREEYIACCSINASILRITYYEGRIISILHVADDRTLNFIASVNGISYIEKRKPSHHDYPNYMC
jgi:hypothetical protein